MDMILGDSNLKHRKKGGRLQKQHSIFYLWVIEFHETSKKGGVRKMLIGERGNHRLFEALLVDDF